MYLCVHWILYNDFSKETYKNKLMYLQIIILLEIYIPEDLLKNFRIVICLRPL